MKDLLKASSLLIRDEVTIEVTGQDRNFFIHFTATFDSNHDESEPLVCNLARVTVPTGNIDLVAVEVDGVETVVEAVPRAVAAVIYSHFLF